MSAEIYQATGSTPELIGGSGGVFDVQCNGKLIFSRHRVARFPKAGEVAALIKELE